MGEATGGWSVKSDIMELTFWLGLVGPFVRKSIKGHSSKKKSTRGCAGVRVRADCGWAGEVVVEGRGGGPSGI